MLIVQKRIKSLDKHFGFVNEGQNLILGVRNPGRFASKLDRIGFVIPLNPGDSVLPAPVFGPVSIFNAEGKYIVHKDRPMETAYRMVEWHWTEWRGRYDTEEMSDFVDVPYQRYPRTFINPPSIELTVSAAADGNLFVISPVLRFLPENHDVIIHTANLFLEIFGECEVFTEDLVPFVLPRVRRVNWQILPPGRYPWDRLQEHIRPIIDHAREGNRPLIENRFSTVNSFNPEFHAIGRAGFWGYVVFGFPIKNIYVFESAYTGNATYIFDEDWEELSKLTKAQILDEGLQRDRVIHRKGWHQRIKNLLS
jgi:hypothetical protein